MVVKGKKVASPDELKRALPQRPLCLVSQRKDGFCDRVGRSRGLCVNHYNQVCRLVRLKKTTWEEQERLKHVLAPDKRRVPSEGVALFLPPNDKKKSARRKKA